MQNNKFRKYIIVHYGELALKLGNRDWFEKKLVENIKNSLKPLVGDFFIKVLHGRFLIVTEDGWDLEKVLDRLGKISGIVYFSVAYNCSNDLNDLKKQVVELIKDEKFKKFRISTNRVNKGLKYSSMQADKEIGAEVVVKLKKKVDLGKWDLNCKIELVRDMALVYYDRREGLSGLPVGSSGKLICLMSGGIDSPVVAYKMMKRGSKNIFVHFHSYPATPKEGIDKVKDIVKILNEYQNGSKLYLIPFLEIQKEVVAKVPDDYRVIFYRRMMYRLAERVAQQEGSIGLVSGDSLGQVASQTLENIRAIAQSVDLPILRPLIGADKEEIIKDAKKINTYEISVQEFQDCCSLYVPKHPVTRADLNLVLEMEEGWEFEKLLDRAMEGLEIVKI